MINLINRANISKEARVSILHRALNATPFFNILEFDVEATTATEAHYGAKVEINKDFYLTELRGNFGEIAEAIDTLFDVSVYTNLRHESVYHFGRNNPLPSGFIATEARQQSVLFDDRQRESIPYLIPNGDKVIAKIVNRAAVAELQKAQLLLSGFTITKYQYLDDATTERLNISLDRPIDFQLFKINVDKVGEETYNITNDQKPRLILAFGVVNRQTSGRVEANVLIKDTSREIRWANKEMFTSFIMPALGGGGNVFDVNKYFLPVEYFFQPFANLQFDIDSATSISNGGFQIVMLTRTV